jgi:hypothetical protein
MIRRILIPALIVCLAVPAAIAKPRKDLWLHVRVEEAGKNGEKVRINVPLELVESILPLIEVNEFDKGKVRMVEWEVEEVDIRAVWQAVRKARDGELVTVEGPDENVSVIKTGDVIHVTVDEGEGDQVEIKVPLSVVDALFSGEEDELDVLAAVQALGEHGPGEIVSVTDQESTVRVWVDEENSSK